MSLFLTAVGSWPCFFAYEPVIEMEVQEIMLGMFNETMVFELKKCMKMYFLGYCVSDVKGINLVKLTSDGLPPIHTYLGVTLDKKMTWALHINKSVNKGKLR